MYRSSTPPPAPRHDYTIDEAVEALSARVVRWTRWLDRGGVALGFSVGASMLWSVRDDAAWGVLRLAFLVVVFATIVVARGARAAIVRRLLARWIAERARADRLDPRELGHRVRMALTVHARS